VLLVGPAQVLERQDGHDDLLRRAADLAYRRYEPVAELGHGLDVLRLTERLAEREDVLRQRGFLDARAGPDLLHPLVLADRASRVGDEDEERVEGLGRHRHHALAAPQAALPPIEP